MIPTRNRAPLLKKALLSLQRQSFENFEVIVSDDHSEDETPRIVESMQDPRFRLVHPPERMIMADHYEFVSTHAAGEYLKYMPDRSVMYSHALQTLSDVIDRTHAPLIGHHSDAYRDADDDNRIFEKSIRTGRLQKLPGDLILSSYYNFVAPQSPVPLATPACSTCHAMLAERVRKQGNGRLINPYVPDVYYPVSLVALCGGMLYVDAALTVGAGFKSSVGLNLHARRSSMMDVLVGPQTDFCTRTPCPNLLLNANLVTDDFLHLQEMFPRELGRYQFDPIGYFAYLKRELNKLDNHGVDITEEFKIFEQGLRRCARENVEKAFELLDDYLFYAEKPLENLAQAERVNLDFDTKDIMEVLPDVESRFPFSLSLA